MKFLFSFILFFAGFVQLSGSSYLSAEASFNESGIEETFSANPVGFHYDVAHSHSPEIRMAEFEIEESDAASKDKQNQVLASLTATQTSVPRCFYFKYKHLKTKARSSLSASVKPYLLFQVFKL